MAKQIPEEVRAGSCLIRKDGFFPFGGKVVGAHELGGQVLPCGDNARLTGGELDEVLDPGPLRDEVGKEGALADARLRLEHEVAAVVLVEKAVDLRLEPLAACEAIETDTFERRPRVDIGFVEALVAAKEEGVAIAGDEEARDDVAACCDRATVGAHLARDLHLLAHVATSYRPRASRCESRPHRPGHRGLPRPSPDRPSHRRG